MSILGGRYTLEVPLGESDLGTVWAAHDTAGAKLVVVTLEDDAEASVAERFREHARALVGVKHAHVAQGLAAGDAESGAPFFVIERIEGPSLAKRLTEGPPLTVARVIEITTAVADALAAAHAAKIAHGDVEPGNVLLADRGGKEIAKVIGFALNRASSRASIARTSLPSLSVLAYAAPEQVRGDVVASALADQASLAAVVYAALAGRPPHVAKDAGALATAIATGTAPQISAVKKELAPFASTLARALSSEPDKRFADLGAFSRALKTAGTMARAVAQTNVPVGARSPIGEPLREAAAVPKPGGGLAPRPGMPAKAAVPSRVDTKPTVLPKTPDVRPPEAKAEAKAAVPPPSPALEAKSAEAAAERSDRVTEKLESITDVLIAPVPPPPPPREPVTEELEMVSLPPSIPPGPPTAAAPTAAAPPPPPPPAASVEVSAPEIDPADLIERNSDGGDPPRSVRPPPPPPPDAPAAEVKAEPVEPAPPAEEASIVLTPSLEEIAVKEDAKAETNEAKPEAKSEAKPVAKSDAKPAAKPEAKADAKSEEPKAKPRTPAPKTIPKPTPEELDAPKAELASEADTPPAARPAWLIPAAALAAVVVLGFIAWRALSPGDAAETQRTPIVDLTTPPHDEPTQAAVTHDEPTVDPTTLDQPEVTPTPVAIVAPPPSDTPTPVVEEPTPPPPRVQETPAPSHTTEPRPRTPETTHATPRTPTPRTPAPRTPAPRTPAPRTPAPRTPTPPAHTTTPAPRTPAPRTPTTPATPPRRPTVVSDPGF